jgi:lysozyme
MVLDLSHHNTVTDWHAIKDAGIVGVIHKATEGSSYVDDQYASRREAARKAGLLWGAYHFLRPGDMDAQAEHFVVQAVDDEDVLLAADHEDAGVSLDDLMVFLDEVLRLTGQRAAIYSGHVLKEQYDGATDAQVNELAKHRLWLAQYSSSPTWPPAWDAPWLWQYTDSESCPGVSGNVDGDSFDGDVIELHASWTGDDAQPPAPSPKPERKTIVIRIAITLPADATVEVKHEVVR